MVYNSRKSKRDNKQCIWCYSDIEKGVCSNKNCKKANAKSLRKKTYKKGGIDNE